MDPNNSFRICTHESNDLGKHMDFDKMRNGIFSEFSSFVLPKLWTWFSKKSHHFISFHLILTWCHFHLDFNLSSASEDGWMRRRRLIRCLTISQLNVKLYDVQTMVLLCIVIWLCLVLNFAKQYPNWMSNYAWLWLSAQFRLCECLAMIKWC